MRGLAEFVMRGRTQAVAVCVLGASTVFFYWIGAAAVALVTLRKGLSEGLLMTMWSLIPTAVMLYFGNSFMPLTVLVGSFACAAILRTSVSWPAALLAASGVGLIAGLALLSLGGGEVEGFQNAVNEFFSRLQQQAASQGDTLELPSFSAGAAAGLIALSVSIIVVLCTVLARYWQAALYNPGGLREEFHALRLPVTIAVPLVVVVVLCYSQGLSGAPWAYLAGLPCIVAGVSLVHKWVAYKKASTAWLVFYYFMLVFVSPTAEITLLAGVLDSWMNLKARFGTPGTDLEKRD